MSDEAKTETTEAKAEPALATTDASRRASALAAVQALDAKSTPPAEEPAEEPEATEEPAETEPAEEKPAKADKVTTLAARLAKQDKELLRYRNLLKQAVMIDDLKKDPLKTLEAAGYGPQQLLDMYLGSAGAAAQRPAPAKTEQAAADPAESELVQIVRQQQEQLAELRKAMEAKTAQDRQDAAANLYRNELANVHAAVAKGGERWEMIAARANEDGLASNRGGAYDLAVETAQAIYRNRIEALGPRPSRQEIAEAAPGWEEVLDLVEQTLVDDWKQRHEVVSKVKKLQSSPAQGVAKKARKSLPPASGETPAKTLKDLTDKERRDRAIAAIARLEKEAEERSA